MSPCPSVAAKSRGVLPPLSLQFRSASALMRGVVIVISPLSTTECSGVMPLLSLLLRSDPMLMRAAMIDASPFAMAACRGVMVY